MSSTPITLNGEPSGPMQKGTTYIVRPRMAPRNRPVSVPRISTGSAQLLVGPASASACEQMKVRLSTRATSLGSLRAWKLSGRLVGSSRVKAPARTSASVTRVHSASEPSHQTTASGCARAATSRTQAIRRAWRVGGDRRCSTSLGMGTASAIAAATLETSVSKPT